MSLHVLHAKNFAVEAAAFIAEQARAALGERGEFRIALSGGNTPRPVYQELASSRHELPWERVFITFGDERCVPPDGMESNYRMARESLFVPAAVPDQSIARMRGEIDPQLAAQEYEDELRVLAAQKGEAFYRHDLILLGMGDDGHTASLFPGTAALEERTRQVVANFVPKFDSWRITFTFRLIEEARRVCFLVDGTKHPELIDLVLGGALEFPAARVTHGTNPVTWIIGT
ncbi:MAG: 6-phosphogluconolactonase [Verrucomicrobiota bacterium]|nr:6-phosphogluconolactonase [Verrucomicrobiota bacterium]